MTIVDRIKNLSDMPINKLEKESGLTNGTICKWAGKNNPSATALYAVAKRLGVSMEYLLTGETLLEEKNFVNSQIINNTAVGKSSASIGTGSISINHNLSDQETELLKLFNSLSVLNKAKLLIYAESLKNGESND
ncbi:MAG: hypothetical protein LUD27_01960 [Clostridia bacterium]|nr:hypothetical protein [Clostridia bacterium]